MEMCLTNFFIPLILQDLAIRTWINNRRQTPAELTRDTSQATKGTPLTLNKI